MIVSILFTHRTTPSKKREEIFNFLEKEIEKDIDGVLEKLLLATCYRVELYLRVDRNRKEKIIEDLIPPEFKKYAEIIENPKEVFEHIVIVASGADSPAVGEPEIQGQVKRAFDEAKKRKWVKKYLTKAFQRALFISKKNEGRGGNTKRFPFNPQNCVSLYKGPF